jgi:hypothetical protein
MSNRLFGVQASSVGRADPTVEMHRPFYAKKVEFKKFLKKIATFSTRRCYFWAVPKKANRLT